MVASRRLLSVCALALCAGSAAPLYAASSIPAAVSAAVDHYARPPVDRARDADRKPAEVLAFSGIKPGDKVGEFAPGKGYYTRILSKLVGPKGHVYTVVPAPAYPPLASALISGKVKADAPPPESLSAALEIQDIRSEYPNVTALWQQLGEFGASFSVPEQLDAIVTVDNYHDLHVKGWAVADISYRGRPKWPQLDVAAEMKVTFRALKPGGVFLIADHAAKPGSGFAAAQALHRSDIDAVKAEVLSAGFVLDGESAILSKPSDDRTRKVFELHDKTDQFVLRFKKPRSASAQTKRPTGEPLANYFGNTSHSGLNGTRQRWVQYQKNGNFQEYGNEPTWSQQGIVYWDADGHHCMLKEFPAYERGAVTCDDMEGSLDKKVGDHWTRPGSTAEHTIEAGIVYPPAPPRERLNESPPY